MPADELDLERGQEEEPAGGGGGGKGRGGGESERARRRYRANIRERLFAIFDRLADSLEGRGDAELAEIVREDSRAMVGGLESAIKRVPGLAGPILGLLGVLEPLIAFGRIFRLLARRMRERRELVDAERELEREERDHAAGYDGEVRPCVAGVEGCEVTVPHRHEDAGIVYY